MASTYKRLGAEDITVTRTPLYEAIPITGTLVSSSVYGTSNIKSYSHGMFQTVYDYPYLSSSANALFDITVGRATVTTGTVIQEAKKENIYNQMCQILNGYDQTGSIKQLEHKSAATGLVSSLLNNAYFLSFSRLLVKDEIKKGTFRMVVGVGSSSTSANDPFTSLLTITDTSSLSNYYVDSPTGEYGILKTSGGSNSNFTEAGLIFYQAGVVVLSPSIFAASGTAGELASLELNQYGQLSNPAAMSGTNGSTIISGDIGTMLLSASIDGAANAFRKRVQSISFNNTTELNSTIYFCRANHNEFNYSSNPTYLSGSKIAVKTFASDAPVSYITTVGLYSVDNELLAVAKLSEPIKKTPDDSILLRVRLDV
jgi:hypothetical protein